MDRRKGNRLSPNCIWEVSSYRRGSKKIVTYETIHFSI
jgi:hypothetical protein